MRKIKYLISALLLFIVVGLAIVTTSLSVKGTTPIASNPDDFQVYFSNVLVNGEQNLNLVQNETNLFFDITLSIPGEQYIIDYDITNASTQYDATVRLECLYVNDYVTLNNNLPTTIIKSGETITGTMSFTLKQSYIGKTAIETDASCSLITSPTERTETGTEEPALPVDPIIGKWYLNDTIELNGETYYLTFTSLPETAYVGTCEELRFKTISITSTYPGPIYVCGGTTRYGLYSTANNEWMNGGPDRTWNIYSKQEEITNASGDENAGQELYEWLLENATKIP